jgi:cell division protein FtsI (penicillin-binding protein 3)
MRPTRRLRAQGIALQRRRLAVVAVLAVVGYGGLLLRAAQLQTLDSEWLRARYERQTSATVRLGPLRGEIADRNGRLLAGSADAESVAASPRRIENVAKVSATLARDLRMRKSEVARMLRPGRSFVWVKRWVTPEEAERVRRAAASGISLQAERKRYYPNRDLAAPYLGFVGRDGEGLSGIELAFDEALRGESADLPALRDPRARQLLHWEGDLEAREGARLVLALDSRLQHYAEAALDRALAQTRARGALLVAMDPSNGDLLAVAERPSFNPNRFWLEHPASFRSRAFVDTFEPGSTIKPFAVAAALEQGAVRASDRFDCENGAWRVADRVIHDYKPHGVLDVRDIVRLSSNIGVAKIADRLGSARLVDGLRGFGFGSRPLTGFPGEAPGVLHSLRESQVVERANLAFGQGLATTPLQLVAAAAAIANGGRAVTPRLALRLERDGKVLELPEERGERLVSESTARLVLEMLAAVVESGSGTEAALPGHRVAGKTGTAQKASAGRYSADRYVASFLGIVPVERPRLVILVVLDEPRGVRFGGVVAAPVFREVAGYALEQLGLVWKTG